MEQLEREMDVILSGLPGWLRSPFLRLVDEGSRPYVVDELAAGREPMTHADGCVVVELATSLALERVGMRAALAVLAEYAPAEAVMLAFVAGNEAVARAAGGGE